MKPLLGSLQLGLLTFAIFALATSLVVALVAPSIARWARGWPPGVAASRLRWLLAAPWCAGLVLTLSAFSPSVVTSLLGQAHHCEVHDGHPHLCLDHAPDGAGGVGGWIALAVLGVVVAVRVTSLVRRAYTARGLVRALGVPAGTERGAHVLATREPFCAAVGWLAPRVVVSDGFLAGMSSEHAGAAVAHEEAHVRRRDAFWGFVARLSATALPAPVASSLLASLDLATERTCDEEAACVVGDRLVVASAIVAGQRLVLRGAGVGGVGFDGSATETRVRALLADPMVRPRTLRRWDVQAAVLILLAFASAGFLHHGAETVIGLAAH